MAVDKLVDSTQLNADLTSVANAIRTKGGTSASLSFPSGFVDAIGNISGGGGGVSNLVTGTFTPASSEKGTAKTLTIPYTGSGFPIAVMIYPSVGTYKSGSDIYNLSQNKAIVCYSRIKADMSSNPSYTGSSDNDKGLYDLVYKNSASDPTQTAQAAGLGGTMYTSNSAGNTAGTAVRVNSATSVSVYVADTSYGFADGIEYTYQVLYSE